MKNKDKSCIFCFIKDEKREIILENEFAFSTFDANPVTKGHALIIPKRHIEGFFELTKKEKDSIDELILQTYHLINEKYSPDGYNIGVNCGEVAGQTVMHVHIHLIPRYVGDVANPRSGVRSVIPEKRDYV